MDRGRYLEEPISIDTQAPRFSWALPSDCQRGSVQAAYRLVVMTAPVAGRATQVWDSGTVASNQTLNVRYASATPLLSDTDYSWSVTWTDQWGSTSAAGNSTFSVAILGQDPVVDRDWAGAQWVSSAGNGSLSTYRAEFHLPDRPVRARLYYVGLGYAKTWVNGNLTDSHELGQYVTFQERVLYDSVDVLRLLRPGKNVLGLMLGNGWIEPRGESSALAPRQFIALLTVAAADGNATRFHSSTVADPRPGALTFHVTAGPARTEDMFKGEDFDGRVAAALTGWSHPDYSPTIVTETTFGALEPVWVSATSPADGPASWGSSLNAHHAANIIQTKEVFTPANISQPVPGKFVFDFAQNMAGQVTLRVPACPAGTVISMQHTEVLSRSGQVRNSFCLRPKKWLCGLRQFANYTCSGAEPEEYRVMFTSMGFRYVEVSGFPGVPTPEALTAHFVHSDVSQTGTFISSSPLLNAIQHATLYSAASNQMDLPTDCPQRERQGWLGDAQLAFETVAHNFDVGAFYSKWVRDLADVQAFDAKTRNASGAMPDTCPFYSSSTTELEADPGWGIAAWVVPTQFSSYHDDDRLEKFFYPHQVSYIEHWIDLAQNNGGELPPTLQHSGDWGCMQPGPTNCGPVEYSQFFYTTALGLQEDCAKRLGKSADAARYGELLKAAAQLYITKYFRNATGCFGNCSDISQIFGLTLAMNHGLLSPEEQSRAWSQALSWFGDNGKYQGRFGGGIVSFKLLYPLLDAFGMSDLGLRQQLYTDKPPSLGYWIAQGGTTLFEYWGNAEFTTPNLLNSYNHIMFGGSGSWYYSTLAGLRRAPGSRSWKELIIAPPAPGAISDLTWANASIDTPMGVVGSAWRFDNAADGRHSYSLHATVPPNARARVIMPTLVAPATAIVLDGGSVVWSHGAVKPDSGIHSASVAQHQENAVVFEVGSGEYVFTTRKPLAAEQSRAQ